MSAVAALDFFSGHAHAILAERQGAPDGPWRLLGSGTVKLAGIEAGRITHLSDAAETVVAVLALAVRAAGRRPEAVFYSLHDPLAALRKVRASRTLPGEGQIRPADVRAAFSAAERLAGCFETANICSSSLGFVIDDQDPILDPVGVFGRKLEVEAAFLQAQSETMAAWKDVMSRAYAPPAWPVSLAQAVVFGALGASAQGKRIVILARGGERLICRVFGTALESYDRTDSGGADRFILTGGAPVSCEVILAGEEAVPEWAERLARETGLVVRLAKPEVLPGLNGPEHAPLAGLLAVAGPGGKVGLSAQQRGRGLARRMRGRLTVFWNEYF